MSTSKESLKVQIVPGAAALDLRTLIPGGPLPGGVFVGLIYTGRQVQALIAGPEYDGELDWNAAMDWAKGLTVDDLSDFSLASRTEQSLAFVNLRSSFKPTWYWSSEQLASSSYFAWSQGFSYGGQGDWTKVSKLRARAFRRLAL
jgi:hypothetical protein